MPVKFILPKWLKINKHKGRKKDLKNIADHMEGLYHYMEVNPKYISKYDLLF